MMAATSGQAPAARWIDAPEKSWTSATLRQVLPLGTVASFDRPIGRGRELPRIPNIFATAHRALRGLNNLVSLGAPLIKFGEQDPRNSSLTGRLRAAAPP